MTPLLIAGVVLGTASALEESTSGFDIGISTDGLWLAVAFAFGAGAAGVGTAAPCGAAALTIANLAYYAAGGGAPDPLGWFALGLGGGAFFGAAGAVFRRGPAPARLAAIMALSGVLIAEGSEIFRDEGELDDGVEFAIGCALPIMFSPPGRYRAVAAVLTAFVAGLGALGALEPLVP